MVIDHSTGALRLTEDTLDEETTRTLHLTIKRVTECIEGIRLNTAISSMMELTNHLVKHQISSRNALEPLIILLAPFAPHFAEEVWSLLGHQGGISYVSWPQYDETKLIAQEVTYPVQVNGKLRAQIDLPVDVTKDDALATAKADPKIARYLEEGTLRREIFVAGRMINLVIK